MSTLIALAVAGITHPDAEPASRLARFGPAHQAALIAIAGFAVLAVILARRSGPPMVRRLRRTLAAAMLALLVYFWMTPPMNLWFYALRES